MEGSQIALSREEEDDRGDSDSVLSRRKERVQRSWLSPVRVNLQRVSGETLAEAWSSFIRPIVCTLDLSRPRLKIRICSRVEQSPPYWRDTLQQSVVHGESDSTRGSPRRQRVVNGRRLWSCGSLGDAKSVGLEALSWLRAFHGERNGSGLSQETARWIFDVRHRAPQRGSFVLGWDTPSAGYSSAGASFSKHTVGHLVYGDLSLDGSERRVDGYLTNRVYRQNEVALRVDQRLGG